MVIVAMIGIDPGKGAMALQNVYRPSMLPIPRQLRTAVAKPGNGSNAYREPKVALRTYEMIGANVGEGTSKKRPIPAFSNILKGIGCIGQQPIRRVESFQP